MSFKIWFKKWRRMFHKFFFMFVGKGYKSEAQKEKEHEARLS